MKKYINSNQKGKEGERELARLLKQYGYACRRGQQYCGAQGDADVIGLPGVHIECKRVEKLDLEKAMQQAVSDARNLEIPVVMYRKNYEKWKAAIMLKHLVWMISKGDWYYSGDEADAIIALPLDSFIDAYQEAGGVHGWVD